MVMTSFMNWMCRAIKWTMARIMFFFLRPAESRWRVKRAIWWRSMTKYGNFIWKPFYGCYSPRKEKKGIVILSITFCCLIRQSRVGHSTQIRSNATWKSGASSYDNIQANQGKHFIFYYNSNKEYGKVGSWCTTCETHQQGSNRPHNRISLPVLRSKIVTTFSNIPSEQNIAYYTKVAIHFSKWTCWKD